MFRAVKNGIKSLLPDSSRRRLGEMRRRIAIGVATTPVSRCFGFDRGQPIDRYFIERFLEQHSQDIRGDVLEISDNTYTRRYGGAKVNASHVLSIDPRNPDATIIADIAIATDLPRNAIDCIICTQTLQFIFDVHRAVDALHQMLRPGGVLLITVPGITQIARYDMDHWGECWRFTSFSMKRLLIGPFSHDAVDVRPHGNVLTSAAFLYGLPSSDLRTEELDFDDRDYEMLITARAVKS